MNYSDFTLQFYNAMSTEELFDYTVIHHCPYSWNLDDYIPSEVEEWILSKLESLDKIGIIEFLSLSGEEAERIYYFDSKEYLQEIKKQLNYNPDGFSYITLSDDCFLLKSIDDLVYGNFGVNNPRSLEDYKIKKED